MHHNIHNKKKKERLKKYSRAREYSALCVFVLYCELCIRKFIQRALNFASIFLDSQEMLSFVQFFLLVQYQYARAAFSDKTSLKKKLFHQFKTDVRDKS